MAALPVDPQPDYGVRLNIDVDVRRVKLGENYSQRVIRGPNRRKQGWKLTWTHVTDNQERVLRDFFLALGTDNFTWTPPGFGEVEHNFSVDKYDATYRGFDDWSVSLDVQEEFDD